MQATSAAKDRVQDLKIRRTEKKLARLKLLGVITIAAVPIPSSHPPIGVVPTPTGSLA